MMAAYSGFSYCREHASLGSLETPRVLALSYLFPNSANPNYGIFVLNRLKAVQQYCDVWVIAPIPWFPFMEYLTRYEGLSQVTNEEVIDGLRVFHPRFAVIPRYLKWWDSISFFLASWRIISKMRNEFDLIDLHWVYPDILTGYVCAKLFKKPIIVTVRGLEALHLDERGLRKRIIDWLLPRMDRVIVLSNQLARLVEGIGVTSDRVTTVLNGVDTSRFHRLERTTCRRHLGLPENKRIVLSVGSLLLSKGFDRLLKIMPTLSKRYDIELYIVGGVGQEGDDSMILENMVNSLELQNVHFVGKKHHDELLYWYNAADVFCLASRSEGCPNVVVEALACGTPVVVSDVGAVQDIVDTEDKGFVFGPRHNLTLEDAMRMALTKAWDRNLIASLMHGVTWDNCARKVISLYFQALGRGSADLELQSCKQNSASEKNL